LEFHGSILIFGVTELEQRRIWDPGKSRR